MALEPNVLTNLVTVKTELGILDVTAWTPSTSYSVGNRRKNSGNIYEVTVAGTSAGAGGPSGTDSTIVDGTVTWKFLLVDDDPYLERLINSASDRIEEFCNRSFFREDDIVEKIPGFGGVEILVEKTPLLNIDKIEFESFPSGDLTLIDPSDFQLDSAEEGIIRRSSGWVWTAPFSQEITQIPVPGDERKAFVVTYDAGFVTPKQVDDGAFGGAARTLPFDVEDACILMVATRFRQKGRDLSIKSEKLLSWAATYSDGSGSSDKSAADMPSAASSLLSKHRFVEMA